MGREDDNTKRCCQDCGVELPMGCGNRRLRCDDCTEGHNRKRTRERSARRRKPRYCKDCEVEFPISGPGSRRQRCEACAKKNDLRRGREWAARRRKPRYCKDCEVEFPISGPGSRRQRCEACAKKHTRKLRCERESRPRGPQHCLDCEAELPVQKGRGKRRLRCEACTQEYRLKRACEREQRRRAGRREARRREPRYCKDCKVELLVGKRGDGHRVRCEACAKEYRREYQREYRRKQKLIIRPFDLIQEVIPGQWVYVLRVVDDDAPVVGAPVKIGESGTLLNRLREHQRDDKLYELRLDAIVPGNADVEHALHGLLAEHRRVRYGKKEREWFDPSPEVLRIVGILVEAFPHPRPGLTESQTLLTPAEILALLKPNLSEPQAAE